MSTKSREVVFGIRFLWCLTRALSAKPKRHSNGYDLPPEEPDGEMTPYLITLVVIGIVIILIAESSA